MNRPAPKQNSALKTKGLLARWLDVLDKKMKEKAQKTCGCSDKSKGSKCC